MDFERRVPANTKPEISGKEGPSSTKTSAVKRLLRRRSYEAQQEMLRSGVGPATGPGEVSDLARAGFQGPARELPHRAAMEKAFGQPLGHVKAHVGPEAAQASAAMGAEAYALGAEVAFDSPTPKPETVAHEVAHVVQQSSGGGAASAGEADLEREADRAAQSVTAGRPVGGLTPERPAVRKKEKLPTGKKGFEQMWAAHPHNYLDDPSQNTDSATLLQEVGLPTTWNTCAIRLSRMLNKIGLKITPAKVQAAGIARAPYYSRKTKEYLILSAKEMWTYLAKNFRKADVIFPAANKTYKDAEDFQKGFEKDIAPYVKSRKGIVAFEKIFSYSGTGHVDLFDGMKLSDAPDWYPSMRVHLWIVAVSEEGGL